MSDLDDDNDDLANEFVTDPKENPTANGHLLVSGESGGYIVDHDPLTIDTNDDPDNDPALDFPMNKAPSDGHATA